MNLQEKIDRSLKNHSKVTRNPCRGDLVEEAVNRGEAFVSKNGALATWTPSESTGRSPKDTLIVQREESQEKIDWDSPNNIPLDPETFQLVLEDALNLMSDKSNLFQTNRVIGADPAYALPTRTITSRALTSLFTLNMFRPIPDGIERSTFASSPFNLLVFPYDKLNSDKYEGRLRQLEDGGTTDMIVAMDFDRFLGVVIGSAYLGTVKKLMFTVMNYLLPEEDVLPLHCSANEDENGNSGLLLGLSGTGKTTLSADPDRALLGDDEHGWGDRGIANFENGCYAKLIDLQKDEEPEIWNAIMHKEDYRNHGAIVENALMYPNGEFDFFDSRLTPNLRGSYPLDYLTNIKESSIADHPETILFLTADANGVIPPISKLDPNQAMLWFLMGYTSKIPGTETGLTQPKSVFSRFFGQPFMPRNPDVYSEMLGEKMKRHGADVYLINTGWTGGPYGEGERIDLGYTRAMVDAALNDDLTGIDYEEGEYFQLCRPVSCPGVPNELLNPRKTWGDEEAFKTRAEKLVREFSEYFEEAYGEKDIKEEIVEECPVK
ncbi:phosphoenolpyruvate carboxykinase (ATP) [Candidatus Bipolaricaulota bacterium]|nr:phosphoenolpyruvate carboxykinase (ATP) [Candidatus Bipolaricaulota bacterium]